MDEFAAKLKTLLDDYPNALQDKRILRSLLLVVANFLPSLLQTKNLKTFARM